MTNDTLKALERLNLSAYGIDIRDADEIDSDVAIIRAALAKPVDVEGLKEAIDWLQNTSFANCYGDKRDGYEMIDRIEKALAAYEQLVKGNQK